MTETRQGILMKNVTGRMGLNQPVILSVLATHTKMVCTRPTARL